MTYFTYRNVTQNSPVRAFAWSEAKVDAKLAELAVEYPSTVFEKVALKAAIENRTIHCTDSRGNYRTNRFNVKTLIPA
jgi:hypothetical protein